MERRNGAEHLVEFLVQLVIEILVEFLFEVVVGLGWKSPGRSFRRKRKASPLLAGLGYFLMGLAAGIVSLIVFGRRLTPPSSVRGLSLIAAPIGTGAAMHWLGEFWRARGRDRPALFTFRAGSVFAFGMALVRFVYLELY